jgi:hypothetical protein
MFNGLFDDDSSDFTRKKFMNFVKKINYVIELPVMNQDSNSPSEKRRELQHLDKKLIESYMKGHIPYFLFFLIEKRNHYVDKNLMTDLNNLAKVLSQSNPNVNNSIDNKMKEIYDCIKESIEMLNNIRTEFFAQMYQSGEDKNCYIFFCNACCITECNPYPDDEDEKNESGKFFTVLNCGHSIHRDCAREHSKKNTKSRVLVSLKTKYVDCALCAIECPVCRYMSYIYY